MNMLWVVAGASLVLALLSWNRARRLGRRLEQLTQMYWELKYQHGELRVQVQRLSGEGPAVSTPPPQPADSFIPLTSLKK
jgi:hypothetical protein